MVLNGIDCIDGYDELFKGKRIGLLTSVTGLTRDFQTTISVLHKRYGLSALFSPEHGVRGNADAGGNVEDYVDEATGVTVYSLYRGGSKRFSKENMDKFDVLVYDIQDVGARFYTFISSLRYAIEDLSRAGKEIIVLDRINLLGGVAVEGNLLCPEYSSFVGAYPVTVRYGLTIGEYANMVNQEQGYQCRLHVIPCRNWSRNMQQPDTGIPYVMPSLGLPKFESALVYPGTCFFEGTNLSEGRGTAAPFEIIGAPYIKAEELAEHMNKKNIPGVWFRPVYFCPTASKHQGIQCQGVQLHILDSHLFEPVKAGFELLYEIMERYQGDFQFLPPVREGGKPFMNLLFGDSFIEHIPPKELLFERFHEESNEFRLRKTEFHLY